ncbi:MAG: histidine kinase [Candidatus Acidiferrales bacterium]
MSEQVPERLVDILRDSIPSASSSHSINKDLLGLCTWQWHIKSNTLIWCTDQSAPARTRYTCADGIDTFLELVSPHHRDAVSDDVRAALSGASCARHITIHPENSASVHVLLRILPICARSGQVVSVIGFCCPKSSPSQELSSQRAMLLTQAEEIARFGTWEFDIESRIATLSVNLAQMLGITPEIHLSEERYWKSIHSADRIPVVENVRSAIAAGAPFQYVARYLLPAGRTRHHLVRGLPNFDLDGRLQSIVGITFDFSDQNQIEGELRRLSQKLLCTRDDERRAIARELHESTGQTLAAVKMSLGRLREFLPEDDPQLNKFLETTIQLAETAIREVRTLSYLMHPPMLDEAGLRSAVRWYAKGFTERSGIPIEVFIPEDFGRHRQEVETTLFRIVQEALTNIHRYSGSRAASIRLTAKDGMVHAVIQDEGCGIPSPSTPYRGDLSLGVGILGMRERVKQLNGTFEIYTAAGKGTTIRATLPADSSSRSVREKKPTRMRREPNSSHIG